MLPGAGDEKYVPVAKIELAPVDQPTVWTELAYENGQLTTGHPDLTKQLTLSLPADFDSDLDDFAAFADNLKQRGGHVRVTLSEDNFASGARNEVILLGRFWTIDFSHRAGQARLDLTAYCRLAKARALGMNISRTTRVLLYRVGWDESTAGVWDASDPDYLVNIPAGPGDGTPAGAGAEDFMPGGLVSLKSKRTGATTESQAKLVEYTPDSYEYSPAKKQIYFKVNRGAVITLVTDNQHFTLSSSLGFETGDVIEIVTGGTVVTRTIADIDEDTNEVEISVALGGMTPGDLVRYSTRDWELKLYYYDPADLSNSVTNFLEFVATGEPWTYTGGLDIPGADMDLDEITGFDNITPLLIRSVLRDKTEGNIQQILEELRDSGLVGSNYRIHDNAATGKLEGYEIIQDDGTAIIPLYGVLETSESTTFEGQAGRVEVYCPATTPENVLLQAIMTVNLTGDLATYDTRGIPEYMNDGRGATQFEVWKDHTGAGNEGLGPFQSDDDFIVFDRLEVVEFRRAMFRGGHPTEDGKPLKDYHTTRQPRWTISASEDPISSTNPGIPISPAAINFEVDLNNVGGSGGYDVDVTADNIHRARYFALRLEQDGYFRRSDDSAFSTPVRESVAVVGELCILGDGRLKYPPGHPHEGQYPFAQITRYGTTVGVVTSSTVFTVVDASWVAIGAWIQVMRAGTPISTKVLNKVGSTLTVETPVTGVTAADLVGEAGRWKITLAATWEDLLYPDLHQKLVGTSDWLDVLEDQRPSDMSEAEGVAVERLLELIKIQRDIAATIAYDRRIGVGTTTRMYDGLKPWTPTKIEYKFNAPGSGMPGVTQQLQGTDFEKEPS